MGRNRLQGDYAMDTKVLPTPDVLRNLLRYDPETGGLIWLPRNNSANFNSKHANRLAFTAVNSRGYRVGRIGGVSLTAHRTAWALFFGTWPEGQIDHVNGDRLDNRIDNLRAATPRENSANKRKKPGASSKFVGVTRRTDTGKWDAQIKDFGKRTHLGCFTSEEAAARAYDRAAASVHGEFAKVNFP